MKLRLLVCLGFAALLVSPACSKPVDEPQSSSFKPTEGTPLPPGPEKLEVVDEVVGTGREAKTGDTVHVHYTGTLMNGKKFDSSRDRDGTPPGSPEHGQSQGEPFKFTLGKGEVIKGWDEGVVGMKVGGKRKLNIPWNMAYGEEGHPPDIPSKAGLKFDVELMSID
jgi:FKBP-type peptidyl-prolyl cis-trans isomerase